MALNYKKLGELISEVDERNSNSSVNNLIGVTLDKVFIPSVANTNGTDLSRYKIIKENQFACSLMQVSRDNGVAISLYKNKVSSIMSPAYYIFEVVSDCILPEYLELVVCSPEFDREATFNAVGGVRGTLTWEDFCALKINIPSIEEQQKIVNQYNTIVNRIDVLERLNERFEKIGDLLFEKNCFKEPISDVKYVLSDLTEIKTGKKDANEATGIGDYPFFTCSKDCLWTDKFSYTGEAILVAGNGDFSIKYYNGAFEAYQRTYILMSENNKYTPWLYFGLRNRLSDLTRDSKGSVISYITKGSLENMTFYCLEDLNDDLLTIFSNLVKGIEKNNSEILLLKKIKGKLLQKIA